jgi:hypothetical protein
LQERIIRRAAELRQEWAIASNQTYTPSIKPAPTQITHSQSNGNTSQPRIAAPLSQINKRPEVGKSSISPVAPPTTGTTASTRNNQISDQHKKYQPPKPAGITQPPTPVRIVPFNLVSYFKQKKLEFIDKRLEGGNIWVIGGSELKPIIDELKKKGIDATFFSSGAPITQNRSAWRIE